MFIIASYYWGNQKYHDFAKTMKQTCKKLGLQSYILYIPRFNGKYQDGINYKPKFILNVLSKFPKHNVLYLDIDLKIKMYPRLFSQTNADFMCFNWNYDPAVTIDEKIDPYIVETAGGIMYFANNPFAKYLLKLWNSALQMPKYKNCADDRVLALVINKHNIIDKLRIEYIPIEYLYIPQFFSHLKLKHPKIIHDEDITTEEEAQLLQRSKKSRIPREYKLETMTEDYSTKKLVNIGDSLLNSRLKKKGFKFSTLYKLKSNNILCKSRGVVFFNLNKVTSDDVLKLWSSHESRCNILISNKYKKTLCKSDIGCNMLKDHKMRFDKQNIQIYLKYNDLNRHLIYEWKKYGNKDVSGLVDTFNNCPSYGLCNRVSKV